MYFFFYSQEHQRIFFFINPTSFFIQSNIVIYSSLWLLKKKKQKRKTTGKFTFPQFWYIKYVQTEFHFNEKVWYCRQYTFFYDLTFSEFSLQKNIFFTYEICIKWRFSIKIISPKGKKFDLFLNKKVGENSDKI